jgi:hypothetical protein
MHGAAFYKQNERLKALVNHNQHDKRKIHSKIPALLTTIALDGVQWD